MSGYRLPLFVTSETLVAYDTEGHPILVAILSWWLRDRINDEEAMGMIGAVRGLVTEPAGVLRNWRQTLAERGDVRASFHG